MERTLLAKVECGVTTCDGCKEMHGYNCRLFNKGLSYKLHDDFSKTNYRLAECLASEQEPMIKVSEVEKVINAYTNRINDDWDVYPMEIINALKEKLPKESE